VSDEQLAAKLQTADEADLQDAHRQIEQLRAALAATTARAEAAERDASDVRRWADAVPVEAIVRTWQRDIHDDPADADAIEQWLARQEVQP
jgi:hypothetical protein